MNSKPLIEITVSDLDSVPDIKYKGQTIKGKVSIEYEWLTRSSDYDGKHNITVKHMELDDAGYPIEGVISVKR